MEMYGYSFQREEDLMHHGIKGMKWGVRRWQNADGTFNEAGKKRYFSEGSGENYRSVGGTAAANAKKAERRKTGGMSDETKARLKTAAKVGAVVAGTALATYGAYKLNGLAVESLKAGDRYLASQKTAMANMHLDNYVKQMGEYYKAKGPNPITNSTNPELYSKLQKMNASADAAARRYIDASTEASKLTARADSGKYTTKEKLDALKRMAKR